MQTTEQKTPEQKTPERKTTVASFAEVREDLISGSKSLHATVAFTPGQFVHKLGAKKILEHPNYLSVQIGDHQHIMLDPEFLQYINHSCEPNVAFDPINGTVTAIRHIAVGDALTFFYPSTEWSMAQGFDCWCQSEKCLGYIQGAAHLPQTILANYTFSDYIQTRMKEQTHQLVET